MTPDSLASSRCSSLGLPLLLAVLTLRCSGSDAPAVEEPPRQQPAASAEQDDREPGGLAGEQVHFRDRTANLRPFLLGFPYSSFEAELEHDQLLYFEKTPEGTWLRRRMRGIERPFPAQDAPPVSFAVHGRARYRS